MSTTSTGTDEYGYRWHIRDEATLSTLPRYAGPPRPVEHASQLIYGVVRYDAFGSFICPVDRTDPCF